MVNITPTIVIFLFSSQSAAWANTHPAPRACVFVFSASVCEQILEMMQICLFIKKDLLLKEIVVSG